MKRLALLALVLLIMASAGTRAYILKIDANGNTNRWNFANPNLSTPTNSFNRTTHAIRLYIASDAYSTTNTAAEINAVRASFGQWQSIPNTVIKYEEAGLMAPGYDANSGDGTNVILWARGTNIIVNGGTDNIFGRAGVTYLSSFLSDNSVGEFDIVLNGAQYSWFTDFNDKNNPGEFIEGTLLHELGHSLGLNHSTIGGATMLYAGTSGVDTQAGLSVDEVAFAHAVYPASNLLSTLSTLKGTITKSGSPVLGAAVIIDGTNGNLAGGSISRSNGTYSMSALPPGNYNVRVCPLDASSATNWLIRGADVASTFSGADTSFLPFPNTPVTLSAGNTNTVNFAVTNGTPAFRIAWIRKQLGIIAGPDTVLPGDTSVELGVFSANLPTNNATFTITGDGLTVGSPIFEPSGTAINGLNGISAFVSVASNATPGLRTLIVSQAGNTAYANGYIEVLPTIADYNFDGFDDVFQRTYFAPFTSTNAAPTADPDHDGRDNYAEYLSGTNPTNAASVLKILSTATTTNGTTVVWQCGPGKHFQLMSRTNAVLGSWQNVGSVITSTNTTAQGLDSSATNGVRFYKVQAL